jgi:predicted phage gp36 major capsid-like protein
VTLPTGNTTSLTYAGLLSLVHSVDPAYRYGGNAKFMLSDTALMAAQLMVDSQNRPLWQPSLRRAGRHAARLRARRQQRHADAGRQRQVGPVRRLPARLRRARHRRRPGRRLGERYADFLQVGWFAYARSDATVQDAAAYKALVQSAT